jgi:hypothetical protein
MFKHHFLAIIPGLNSVFSPYLWDLLLPQAKLTLNLLRQATINQGLVHGPFDFNKMPLGPVGCCILIHPLHKRKEICHTMVVCEVQPDKDDPNCTQITICGNRIYYPGDVGTNTASLELLKLLLNSVLSQKGARFSSIDLKSLYLDMPMPKLEYICIKILDIPQEFIDKNKLTGL